MKDKLFETFYELSKKPYQKYFKKSIPWSVNTIELMTYNENSLGYHYGKFILDNNFQMQPKLENHDVFHVLTNTGTSVAEEIGMQYYLLGNGKRSLYLFLVIISGTFFYPDRFDYFLTQFERGNKAHVFHYLDFSKMLQTPIATIQETFNIK